ncbi:GNAT family N-acetyltransferase [Flexibacterium corallicola]|uniref:GNAT family N-acetyltransferase n=1 Tax=Flexibacterium corallicola TaxID=3037259 RepID=UPI00286F0B15|nr:GNAT family N-acetyltransferase [Pseudovibrio sp. M1P-2-3]
MIAKRPSDITPIWLRDKHLDKDVDAELWNGITDKNLADWEAEWVPHLQSQLKRLNQQNISRNFWPQSRHWNWRDKQNAIATQLSNLSFAIVAENMTQAMMIIDLTKRAQLPSQKSQHIVYVDFLEAAPWNRNDVRDEAAKFGGCGSILINAAIQQSILEGFKGKVGLHSLPQSNVFYANACGMTDLGQDASYHNLRYFEFDPDSAQRFLEKGRGE